MNSEHLTPARAAYRLTRLLNAFAAAHNSARFPVNVEPLAYEAATIFGWQDPIISVQAAEIPGFEGALVSGEAKAKWMLLYNSKLSPGRIRFTQAHELGHYLLHRSTRDLFQCTDRDMLSWRDKSIEAESDEFASTLLMPLDDFRQQVTARPDLEMLASCAERYGVSLTAAILKWLQFTDECALLVVSRDGFVLWARSSDPAFNGGAFIKSRGLVVPLPENSLASDPSIRHERNGVEIPATTWFAHARREMMLREFKISADQYDWTMTLLLLPRGADVWKPRERSDWP